MAEASTEIRNSGQAASVQAGDSSQFLTFTVGESEYGVDIMMVREIKGWTETTRLPNTPEYIRGVMNLRGSIIPTFDLRCRFGQGLTKAHAKNVVVILAVGSRNVGVLVDAVSDILTVQPHEIKASPEVDTAVDERFVTGLIAVEDRMVVVLDINHLFDAHHIENLIQQAA